MPNSTIHVFVGAGPANLHRALALRKVDPDAKFVFIDSRFKQENADPIDPDNPIDRATARANIFRFETEDVTRVLLAEGIEPSALQAVSFERSPERTSSWGEPVMVFQSGDAQVFGSKPFTQIQIRDLQLLLLRTIKHKSGSNASLFIKKDLGSSVSDGVKAVLEEHATALGMVPGEYRNIHIHVATGALKDDEKDAIVYRDKMTASRSIPEPESSQTADVARMIVTPVHGTVTFKMSSSDCTTLRDGQVSLDNTSWQASLAKFGWTMLRPPRIRVFYANDILYIGAEIPHEMKVTDDDFVKEGDSVDIQAAKEKTRTKKKEALTTYMRTIGQLIFPHVTDRIKQLPVHSSSTFETPRGQRGLVLEIERTDPKTGVPTSNNITTFYHGDGRYLPHYQTGSGFVTAFLENELYRDIYQHKTIEELLAWLYTKPGVSRTNKYSVAEVIKNFSDDLPVETPKDEREKYALEAFKACVFKELSLDIIEDNQQKVGRYLNALHSQTLQGLGNTLDQLIASFNQHHHTVLQRESFSDDPRFSAIALLQEGNVAFLREWMPRLLNLNLGEALDDEQLKHLRDMAVKEFQFGLMAEKMLAAPRQAGVGEPIVNYQHTDKNEEMKGIQKKLKHTVGLIKADRQMLQDLKQASTSWRRLFFPTQLLRALQNDLNTFDNVRDVYLSLINNTGSFRRFFFQSLRRISATLVVEKLLIANKYGLLRANAFDENFKAAVYNDFRYAVYNKYYYNSLRILNNAGLLGGAEGKINREKIPDNSSYGRSLYKKLDTMQKLGLLDKPHGQKNFDAIVKYSGFSEWEDCVAILASHSVKLLGGKNTQHNFDVLMKCFLNVHVPMLSSALGVLEKAGLLSSDKAEQCFKVVAEHPDPDSIAGILVILSKQKQLTDANIAMIGQAVRRFYRFDALLKSIETSYWSNDNCLQIAMDFYTQHAHTIIYSYEIPEKLKGELNNLLMQATKLTSPHSTNQHSFFQSSDLADTQQQPQTAEPPTDESKRPK